ncbi:two-component sensor histidine kinase BarA, partial [Vibrio parahaemolyticus]|nr:two-component sensor histidine kinase BarA [Vibrio parahaemolyticus]
IVQQLLVQAGLTVTYRSAMPEESDHFDYVLLNLAPSKETDVELVEQWVQRAIGITSNVIVGTPSTELALADLLMKQYPVQCITKPLSRKKLLQTLIAHQPAVVEAPPQELPVKQDKMPLTVMAVDDNPANLKLITALLQERV